MDAIGNSVLGIVFLAIATLATFLMYHLWGYPFDHVTNKSDAPPFWMRVHRILGWTYVVIYIFLMVQMIPRLWQYQIELPARTVAHLMLGMAIGAILILKIVIVRFFKHLEATLIPALGTSLFIATFLLIGLSVPFVLRQSMRIGLGVSGEVAALPNQLRVRALLKEVGLADEALQIGYTTPVGLSHGERLLTTKCVRCHDLRTTLVHPRTASAWRSVVTRMAERAELLDPISESQQWQVTAYLIAISPQIQQAREQAREQAEVASQNMNNFNALQIDPAQPFDHARAQQLVQTKCTECHGLEKLDRSPPNSLVAAKKLVGRMVEEGFTASDADITIIVRFLAEKYASVSPAPVPQTPASN